MTDSQPPPPTDEAPTTGSGDRTSVLYRAVGLGRPAYRRDDVARLAGIDRERSVEWWRAMGFAEVPKDVAAFTQVDVDMVRRLVAVERTGIPDEVVLRLARLTGAACSRIADAQLDVANVLTGTRPGGTIDVDVLTQTFDQTVLDLMEDSIVYVWRRHLLAAVGRRLAEGGDGGFEQAVGFADLSGFTKLSQRVPAETLGELVDEFERAALDVVSTHNGRAVKLIGDEVMFVAGAVPAAVDIALDLADRLAAIDGMPEMHCGITFGSTMSVGGDVFGPPVNLASRLTTVARRGTIVLERETAAALADRDDLELVPIRRRFDLKGIGLTRVVAVRRLTHDVN